MIISFLGNLYSALLGVISGPDIRNRYDVQAPTVSEIVKTWLSEHGYDGLCSDGCGCDGSAPCECNPKHCKPAYKVICKGIETTEGCNGCDYSDANIGGVCYTSNKPEVAK